MTGPEPKPPQWHEEAVGHVELFISNLLRVGVTVSIGTILVGVVLMFVHHPNYLRPGDDLGRLTKPGAAFPQTLAEVKDELLAGRGQAVVCVGLLMLIATPILRAPSPSSSSWCSATGCWWASPLSCSRCCWRPSSWARWNK